MELNSYNQIFQQTRDIEFHENTETKIYENLVVEKEKYIKNT